MVTWILAGGVLTMMILNVGVLLKVLLLLDELRASATLSATTQEEIQAAARVVAKDLAARYVRADAVDGVPGEAADVAARSQQED